MISWFNKHFGTPSTRETAQHQVERAELDLLHAEERLEYYQAIVPMLHGRVTRLNNLLNGTVSGNNAASSNYTKGSTEP